jgi:hypothetical protein
MSEFVICSPTLSRVKQVGKMTLATFPEAHLFVYEEQRGSYEAEHPTAVRGTYGKLGVSYARNAILKEFPESNILMADDDILEIGRFEECKAVPLDHAEIVNVVSKMFDYCE